jgi:hypothetical protein
MKRLKHICIGLLLILSAIGCTQREEPAEGNAVYYWRTDLRLDSTERAFLNQYHIRKVYCRYFDVVINDTATGPVPNATLSFSDSLPAGVEIIPTIYITENCMHKPYQQLAERLVQRIRQMNETNDMEDIREIQIDCDYTSKSRKRYYAFLEEVGRLWNARLSTTIRLHQLSMPAPPVDYGALMVYNTGDPRKSEERNPILDYRDVAPYLNRLDSYPLPLATAYPVFRWLRIVYGVRYEYTVEAEEILKVKHAMEKERGDLSHSIITYHLDKDNIDRYKPDTYEEIYHH